MGEKKAYCVKCRHMVDISGAKKVKLKNGRWAMKGKCKKCGTKVFRFIKKNS